MCLLCRDPMLRRLEGWFTATKLLLLPRRLIIRLMSSVSAGLNHSDSERRIRSERRVMTRVLNMTVCMQLRTGAEQQTCFLVRRVHTRLLTGARLVS